MRLHSDTLSHVDVGQAAAKISGVILHAIPYGSRSHRGAVEVKLESDGTPDIDGNPRRRRINYGTSRLDRRDRPFAASWADWGRLIAALYDIDEHAIWGNVKHPVYGSRLEFHQRTVGRFLPDADHDLIVAVNSHAEAWDWSRNHAR